MRSIVVPRTARVVLVGEPGPEVREVLVVLHGYGQHAREVAEECAHLAGPARLVAAPEGLSRFYLRGTGGATGASWMTREARESEIADHVGYLDAFLAELATELPAGPRVHVLGFSQGTATACRWVALGTAFAPTRDGLAERAAPGGLAGLTLWAGGVPPDLDLAGLRARAGAAVTTLVVGSQDRWIDEARLAGERARLEAAGLAVAVLRFDGGHRLDHEVLGRLLGSAPQALGPRGPRGQGGQGSPGDGSEAAGPPSRLR